MKSIYITSIERYSGKTAFCLAFGKRLQDEGKKVGYLKPVSLQPWFISGHIADEDAEFVKNILGLPNNVWDLSPVVITDDLLKEYLREGGKKDYFEVVKDAYQNASKGEDILILEGGGSLREGYIIGLPTPFVAKNFGSSILVLVKFRDKVRVIDDTLAAMTRLGDLMAGVVLNRVPKDELDYVYDQVNPFLEREGVSVFGVLPEERTIAALTVDDLVSALDAEILTKNYESEALVENLTVGAMTAEAALSRFRRYPHKAVITGGDRADIQLAALETSTTCLVLTGNLRPSPLIIKQAENYGVSILLVRTNTMETVEKIESIYGKTRLGHKETLKRFQELLDQYMDFDRFYQKIGL